MHLPIWRLFQNIPPNLAKKNPLRLPAIMPGLRLHSNSYGCCYGKVLGFKPREYHYQYQVPGIQEADEFFSGPCSLLGTLNPGWTLRASSTSLLVGVDWMIHSWKSPRNLPMKCRSPSLKTFQTRKILQVYRCNLGCIFWVLYMSLEPQVSSTCLRKSLTSFQLRKWLHHKTWSTMGIDPGMLKWAVIDLIHILWLVRIGRRSNLQCRSTLRT